MSENLNWYEVTSQNRLWRAALLLAVTFLWSGEWNYLSGEEVDKKAAYPLGLQLRVLADDLVSDDYHRVLETMIPTDLAAEWLRVGTPDNYLTFAKNHGGREKVLANDALKKSYEKRKRIADQFLKLMNVAYKKRDRKPPYDEEKVRQLLKSSAEKQALGGEETAIPIRVIMPAAGAEKQWPRFRGPTGQGNVTDSDFPKTWGKDENILWKTELPDAGNSSPVIWDNRIFVTAASKDGLERTLLCYSRTEGRLLWEQTVPAPVNQEKLYWKNTYASSTPVTDGERVVVFFGNSGLFSYDFEGNLQWQQNLGPFGTSHGPGSSPLIYKDKVIFIQYQNRGDSVFVALDKRTGKEQWRQQPDNQMCWSTPVILRVGNHDELVYNGSHRVVGYDPQTGEELWRMEGSTREAIPTIVIGGGLMFSTSGRNGASLAIRPGGKGDVTKTHLLWKTHRGGSHVPSPVYYKGKLFMISDTGIASCLDAQTGASLWQKRLRGRFSMSPLQVADKLILTNERGLSYILTASSKFEVLAKNDLEEDTLATPAVLGGRIYFRTANHLLCIGSERADR